MRIRDGGLPGILLVENAVFEDARGFFLETFQATRFAAAGLPDHFVQDNHSRSTRGVLRGMHWQVPPRAQGKLVRAVTGEVFDVAVDVRRSSPTFGKWCGVTLTTKNMVWVPPGFAHGFCVLSETADVEYKVTDFWSAEHERALAWNDPTVGIEWPTTTPVLSEKDATAPRLEDAETFP